MPTLSKPKTIGHEDLAPYLLDPFRLLALNWPKVKLYDKQAEIIQSVIDNDETIVPAANQMGKDFISGFITLWFFLSRSPCRIVTTSASQSQLESVLWGEMRRFIETSQYELPLKVGALTIKQVQPDGTLEPRSYIRGIVAIAKETMQGHHLERGHQNATLLKQVLSKEALDRGPDGFPRTMALFDEASSIDTEIYDATDTWAHRKLGIGNCLPCANFFKDYVDQGDVPRPSGIGHFRKIIKIKASDSPNVKYAEAQIKRGIEPDNKILLPGVVDYATYLKRRQLWDSIRQCVGLDAEFYEGAEVLLYPPQWLNRAEEIHEALDIYDRSRRNLKRTMGVDAAEGGDDTVWTVIDKLGVLYQLSLKTQDTSDIPGRTIQLINEWNLTPSNVLFDRGGGGKQHVDALRRTGYNVRSVGFGESATDDTNQIPTNEHQTEVHERKYIYKNRRAEMYGLLRTKLLDPTYNDVGFAISRDYVELRRQLAPLPMMYDDEGRMYLPPKNDRGRHAKSAITIKDILGCSPDEADSLVLAVFGLYSESPDIILRVS